MKMLEVELSDFMKGRKIPNFDYENRLDPWIQDFSRIGRIFWIIDF